MSRTKPLTNEELAKLDEQDSIDEYTCIHCNKDKILHIEILSSSGGYILICPTSVFESKR
jgi:hypothetical protein